MRNSKEQIQSLAEMLRSDCVFLVGAGASRAVGLPTTREMLATLLKLVDELDERRRIRNLVSHDWQTAISALGDRIGWDSFLLGFRNSLAYGEQHARSLKPLRAIVNSADLIITTNLDSLLEQAAAELGEEVEVVLEPSDVSKCKIGRKRIVKLHGDLKSPETVILSRAAYESSEAHTRALLDRVVPSLAGRNLVIVGYSPRDPQLLEILQKIRVITGDRIGQVILIAPEMTKVDSELLKSVGVNGVILEIDELTSIIEDAKRAPKTASVYRWKAFFSANRRTTRLIGPALEIELAKSNIALERLESIPTRGKSISEKLTLLLKEVDLLLAIIEGRGVERPNPNVFFELGYFAARCGWDRVIMFVQKSSLLPADLQGLEYFQFDRAGDELVKTISGKVQLVTKRLSSSD